MFRKDVGIIGIEYAFPGYYVDQKDLARVLNYQEGKLTVGLGLQELGCMSDREDPLTLALNAVKNLLKKYNINVNDVGRLEVGTESNFDGSKSFKTHLLSLFEGNTTIMGVDSINACYGGTNALFNAIFWMDSNYWDGRYAIVVATDYSIYQEEAAVPTTGAGAVAILLGKDPVFIIKPDSLSHYFANEFDFMKPKDIHPFPIMNAKKSIEVYLQAFKECYEQIQKKEDEATFDYICMHSPYPRLPEKTCDLHKIPLEKLQDSLFISRRNGNSYTSSLYFCLISLLHNKEENMKLGTNILMFSFGSGCASSMFILTKVRNGVIQENVNERLNERIRLDANKYMKRIRIKQNFDNYQPLNTIPSKGFVLDGIQDYIRFYKDVTDN
ncbi:Hydroxymethylglutaryl-CoA synthase [Conglomerata obtusa]